MYTDYMAYYEKHYKRLPMYRAIMCSVLGAVVALFCLFLAVNNTQTELFPLYLIMFALVGLLTMIIAITVYFLTAITISQNIVLTDTVLRMSDQINDNTDSKKL